MFYSLFDPITSVFIWSNKLTAFSGYTLKQLSFSYDYTKILFAADNGNGGSQFIAVINSITGIITSYSN